MADARPEIGDIVEMSSMGADVRIEICDIPDDQPRAAEGVWNVVDQYQETHRVELDGETWVTINENMVVY